MPFMPEMYQFCGKRFQVGKRAHKTCDPVNGSRAGASLIQCISKACAAMEPHTQVVRRLPSVLEGSVAQAGGRHGSTAKSPSSAAATPARGCTEDEVLRGTIAPNSRRCGGTDLRLPGDPSRGRDDSAPWWNPSQYIEDFRSATSPSFK